MVNEALQRVPNDNGDKYIDEVNQIRDSLAVMGNNSTAFSLPQPHLQRTKLCDMEDKELEPLYVKRREQLKQLVSSIVKPKIVQGRTLNGKDFVSFLQQILEALNKGEIPSTGSLVEIFNKAILDRCLKVYREKMDGLGLPVPVDKLQKLHEMANGDARILFDKQHFGKHHAAQSALKLEDDIKKVYRNLLLANEYQSSKLCEARFSECEDKMDHLQVLKLPSMAKFNAGFTHCNQSFVKECVGPSKESYERRMSKVCLLILNTVVMSVTKGLPVIMHLQPSFQRQTSLLLFLFLVAVILNFVSFHLSTTPHDEIQLLLYWYQIFPCRLIDLFWYLMTLML
ncbi:Guanylate-binding family protein [Zea mays]|uniref:Guanylate-binding family protein n=1 Tax=Zea mays TaxID=4577 RepID=A0A1D6L7T2_MAIZE|nr:Guanylate-binding family protein [Zea mays]ONM10305.1 Guanylate-binding family protein [Zea mays]